MLVKECEYILKLYQERSFSRAAEKLYMTQPALSIAVKRFEERIGATLFKRNSVPLQLTPEGEVFIEILSKMYELQREFDNYIAVQNASKKGCIDIISSGDYFSCALPQIIDSFRERFPNYEIKAHNVDTKDFKNCLDSGLIDMCFTVKDFEMPDFECVNLYTEKLLLAVPVHFSINQTLTAERMTFSDIAERKYNKKDCHSVSIDKFKEVPFLLLQEYNDLSQRMMNVFSSAQVTPKIIMRLDQMLTTYYVSAAGVGATFIRTGLIENVKPTDKLYFYKINDPRMKRIVKLYYRKSTKKESPYTEFINFVRSWSEAVANE